MAAFLFKFLFRILSLLPLAMLHKLGSLLGWLIYLSSPSYAKRTRENLRLAFPELPDDQFKHLLNKSIAQAGQGFTELAWVWLRPYEQVLSKLKQCVGVEHIHAAQAAGKGIIFLTPHQGCFEISAMYAAAMMPITVLYRSPKLQWVESLMLPGRTRGQAKLAKADLSGVKLLFKALKNGEAIGLLPDQVPGNGDGEWVEFFNRPAYTMTLVSRLARSTDATVLITYSQRFNNHYVLHIAPLTLDFDQPVPRQINAAIENTIRACPEQYLWSYNRYKTPRGVTPAPE